MPKRQEHTPYIWLHITKDSLEWPPSVSDQSVRTWWCWPESQNTDIMDHGFIVIPENAGFVHMRWIVLSELYQSNRICLISSILRCIFFSQFNISDLVLTAYFQLRFSPRPRPPPSAAKAIINLLVQFTTQEILHYLALPIRIPSPMLALMQRWATVSVLPMLSNHEGFLN